MKRLQTVSKKLSQKADKMRLGTILRWYAQWRTKNQEEKLRVDSKFQALYQALEKAARVRQDASIEERLKRWAAPPSQTEIDKCERAERMIREAINDDPVLSKKNIRVFAKGSYANRTNIPSDSDVDVGVLNQDLFFAKYPEGITDSDVGLINATYTFSDFFKDVARAIENKFGKTQVTVTDKCIIVRSNSCRVDADVVPHAVHRRYSDKYNWIEGVALPRQPPYSGHLNYIVIASMFNNSPRS